MEGSDLPLLVGGGAADITPPREVGILMSAADRRWEPFEGVRKPLHARAVVLGRGEHRVGLVSLDLLGLCGRAVGGMRAFKRRAVACSDRAVRASHLILTATHTHSAPDSLALTDLHHTEAFKQWADFLAAQIGAALRRAADSMCPCRLAVGIARAEGLAIHRRIKTKRGVVLSHPEPPPDIVLSREGPVDDTVHVAGFIDASQAPRAIVVNAVCHPVHEMCIPLASPDYPGEMGARLERLHPGTTVLYFNGAGGNINPPTVSGGAGKAERHGRELAGIVEAALPTLRPVQGEDLGLLRRTVALPARTRRGLPGRRPLRAELTALRVGSAAFLFLPGEPFVEIGLAIRRSSPFGFTAVAGYAEDYIGYLPTDSAFEEGGYELGPGGWARAGRGSEKIIVRESLTLLRHLSDRRTPEVAAVHCG
jgi:neutral ceramidase